MTFDEIKDLIGLVLETGIAELEVGRGEDRVRIRRSNENSTREIVLPALQHATAPHVTALTESGTPAHNSPQAGPGPDEGLEYVKSPIVGTFYEAPAPDADPFVNVGDRVQAGQVLCIIESMKLMNEIESEVSGVVVRRLIENGRPVEYGEALFAVRPD